MTKLITPENLNRSVLNLAVPNILSNVAVPLLAIVDLSLMGHLGTQTHIGAVALGGMIFNFLYWALAFLRMGTSGLTAQAYGKQDNHEMSTLLYRALTLSTLFGLLIILFQYPIGQFSFYLINGSDEVETLARTYFFTRVWAAPATIGLFALSGWFIGMQNSWIPLTISLVSNITNIALSFIFVVGLDMGVKGVALGTVLAQYLGFVVGLFYVLKQFRPQLITFQWREVVSMNGMKRFMSVNSNIFIRTMCVIIVFTFFTSRSAANNTTILAVNTLLLQFLMFFSYLIDGFAYAAEALVGRFEGAKDRPHLLKVIRLLFVWGFGVALLFTFIYVYFGDSILRLLTSEHDVINASQEFMKWVYMIPLVSFASFVWDGVFIGKTASKQMRNALLIATLVFFFPTYYALQHVLGNHALWVAMLAFMGSRGIVQTFMSRKVINL